MKVVVATKGQTGLAVSADGEVSVNKKFTYGALAREDEPAPSRHHSVTMPDDDDYDEIPMREKMSVCICSLMCGSASVAMAVVGFLDFNLCPGHTRLAIYMIVQGATSVAIPILASCWFCCKCISGNFIGVICVIIGLFNIAWGIVGSVWLASSPCKDTILFSDALGYSVPMWIFFCLVPVACVYCVRWCCNDDD